MSRTYFFFSLVLIATIVTHRLQAAPNQKPPVRKASNSTAYDVKLIRIYTQTAYELVNNLSDETIDSGIPGLNGPLLLNNVDGENAAYKLYVQLIRAIDRLPSYQGIVLRGLYSSSEKDPADRFYKGKVWKERRFSSATKNQTIADEFSTGAYKAELRNLSKEERPPTDYKRSVLLRIKSLSGRDVSKISAKPEEEEVLFKPTIFKVMDTSHDGKGRLIVEMEEQDPAKLSAEDQATLQQNEGRRVERLKEELKSYGDLQILIAESNRQHERWAKTRYLEKENLSEDFFLEGD
jgi:hypothetical protein